MLPESVGCEFTGFYKTFSPIESGKLCGKQHNQTERFANSSDMNISKIREVVLEPLWFWGPHLWNWIDKWYLSFYNYIYTHSLSHLRMPNILYLFSLIRFVVSVCLNTWRCHLHWKKNCAWKYAGQLFCCHCSFGSKWVLSS